jgi:catechol-2,3-dioxygenase
MIRSSARAVALVLAATPLPMLAQARDGTTARTPVQAALMAPGLRVTDIGRSTRFYEIALGLVPATTLHHGPVTEVMLCADTRAGRLAIILMRDETPGASPPMDLGNGLRKIVMRVPDLAAVITRMKAAGYPVGEIRSSKSGPSVLMIQDPDGYGYELVGNGPSHG